MLSMHLNIPVVLVPLLSKNCVNLARCLLSHCGLIKSNQAVSFVDFFVLLILILTVHNIRIVSNALILSSYIRCIVDISITCIIYCYTGIYYSHF